ncbi:MAG: NUMOD4 domain-containing protein [Nitrosopumilus sp.]
MIQETWKPIVGYEDAYEISDLGRVRSLDRIIAIRFGVMGRLRGKMLKVYTHPSDHYPTIRLKGHRHNIHTLVLTAFRGSKPKGMECGHLNDDPVDNRLCNLEWMTHKRNGELAAFNNTGTGKGAYPDYPRRVR